LNKFHQLSDNLKGIAFLMLAAFCFSLMTVIVKLTGELLHVTQILMVRQIGLIIFVISTLINNFPNSLKSSRIDLQLARILFALVAMLGGFVAVINMPLADATAIGFSKSFFVTIFAVLILHEAVGVYRWCAVVVGFVGVLLMLRPGSDDFSIYGVYALIGAGGAAIVMIIIRLLTRTDHPNTLITYQAFGIGLAMLGPGLYFWIWPTLQEWLLLSALAIVSYFSQKCNIYAYKWGEASVLASLDYVRLIYATLFGYLIFNSFPGINTWAGAGLIVTAAIFTVYREAKRKKLETRGALLE